MTAESDDICGYCGEPGTDKMALWTGGVSMATDIEGSPEGD
jgi:hypothetical protein